jgi:ammonia channel protein AmtB
MPPIDQIFPAQNTANSFLVDFFYIFSSSGGFIGILALALLDAGSVRPIHLVDTLVLKLTCVFTAGASFLVAGYGVWNWQFDQALGLPHPLRQSLSDWWLGGPYLTHVAQNIDPQALPGADTQQIFVIFFFTFACLIGAFIHSMGIERMKPLPCIILAAVAGGVLMPLLTYFTWGPVGPLTNCGLHDFVGAYSLYMFVGTWALIFAWRLGPRASGPAVFNPLLIASGVMLLIIAVPIFVVGCGELVPGQGYYGITNVNSGLGLVYVNIAAAFAGGTLSASWLGYRQKNPGFVLFGPIAGYIGCCAFFDIAQAWQCLLIGFASPFVMLLSQWLVNSCGVDDQKLVPLALGPSIFSVLMAGIIGHGLPTGGLSGMSGAYGFEHARISLSMQAFGAIFTLAFAGSTGLLLAFLLEQTTGLRMVFPSEQHGLDATNWNIQTTRTPEH